MSVQDVRCGKKGDKVVVCHKGKELCISADAVAAHLAHGDALGGCGSSARIGVEESSKQLLELSLKAFPNPGRDAVTVEVLSPVAGAATFEVLDVQGRARQSRSEVLC